MIQFLVSMRTRTLSLAFIALVMAGQTRNSLACRYNVRETGFVDFGIQNYRLHLLVDAKTPESIRLRLQKAAEDACRDSNVMPSVVPTSPASGSPALESGGGNPSLPSAVLFSPDDTSLVLEFEASGEELAEAFEDMLADVVSSPLRRRILEEVHRYALVLFFEGSNASENEKAYRSVRDAIREIDQNREYMPKPIHEGPAVLKVSAEAASSEEILLWSLGLSRSRVAEPRAVVVYGRARRLGPALQGGEIAKDIVYRILAVVGADCECGLDPRLIRGTPVPLKWDSDIRARVSRALGFDPDNPMVKLEISGILKLRARLFPSLPASTNMDRGPDDLPVPFVEDVVVQQSQAAWLPRLAGLFALLVAIVAVTGAGILLRARKRDS